MENVFITGANRGIGLGLTQHYLVHGRRVFATARTPENADALHALKTTYGDNLHILPLIVTDETSIADCVVATSRLTDSLDILINNAGINPETPAHETFGKLQSEAMQAVLLTNSIAPMLVAQGLYPLLKNGTNPRIANTSSSMGSISMRRSGGSLSYCASKACLNMLTRGLAFKVKPDGVTAVALDPGWVRTDMGGSGASLSVEQSAEGCFTVIDGLTLNDAGRYLVWDGSEHNW